MRLPPIPTPVIALLLAASPLAAQWEVRELVDDSSGERTRFAAAEVIGDGYEGSEQPYVGLQCDAAGGILYFETGDAFLDMGGRPLTVRLRVDDGEPTPLVFRTTPLGTGAFRACCEDLTGDELAAFASALSDMRRGSVLEVQTRDLQGLLHGLLFPLDGVGSAIDSLDCFAPARSQLDSPPDDADGIAAAGGPDRSAVTARPHSHQPG